MSQKQDTTTSNQLMLFAVASPAKTYPWPDAARDWMEGGADCGLSTIAFCERLGPTGLLSRMSPVCYPATEGEILPSSFEGWSSAGMACAGGYSTLSLPEWRSGADVCGLSQVLETDAPPKYFLSARAARGILRRAARRGKELPPMLHRALLQVAQGAWERAEGKTPSLQAPSKPALDTTGTVHPGETEATT